MGLIHVKSQRPEISCYCLIKGNQPRTFLKLSAHAVLGYEKSYAHFAQYSAVVFGSVQNVLDPDAVNHF
jgi:hypothetical protein